MKNFLSFRLMVTPLIVQILFWLAVIVSVVVGIYNFIYAQYGYGVEIIILGPIVARLIAELLLIIFRIYATLVRIEQSGQNNG